MFPPKALRLASLILITLTAAGANPLSRRTGKATLTLNMRVNESGMLKLVENDRARISSLQNRDQLGRGSTFFNVANTGFQYTTPVGVGCPATYYTLIVDTGSANTWVGASKPYIPTKTSKDTGETVYKFYSANYFSGEEWTDTVTLAPNLMVENQSIGVSSNSTGFTGVDGILGIGPIAQTNGTVTNTTLVPTVPDNLYRQGKITEEIIGVLFVPSSEQSSSGTLTFGGVDDSAIAGPVKYFPLTKTFPSSTFWGIDQSIYYGDTLIISTSSGIVDTGSTLIYLTSDAFQKYQSATGGVFDSNTGLLAITQSQYSSLKPLSFTIEDTSYDLSPNAQIWPRSLNTAIGGNSTAIYLVLADFGDLYNPGFDFVNGYVFLQRYYSVFDTTNQRIGFAPTRYTTATTN